MGLQIVADLQHYIEYADRVILIGTRGADAVADMLCRSEALMSTDKRVVVISTANFPVKPGKHICRTVTEREMRALLDIYRSYEASDKIFLLSGSRNYGSMWNYVNSGMISKEEMLEAMLA